MERNPSMWTVELKAKIAALWEKSQHDRDALKALIKTDPIFKKVQWEKIEMYARRVLPGYRNAPMSRRFVFSRLDAKKCEQLKQMLGDSGVSWKSILEEFPGYTDAQFRNFAKHHDISIKKWHPSKKSGMPEAPQMHETRFIFEEDNWPLPEVVQISKEAWERLGKRVLYLSRLDFEAEGFRKDLTAFAVRKAAEEGFHFPVFAGGLVHKDWLQAQIKEFLAGYPPEERPERYDDLLRRVAHGVSSCLPQIKDPGGKLVKWYVYLSYPFDGPHAARVLQHLEKHRSDIRKGEEGGGRLEIWKARGEKSVFHGVVLQKRMRGHGRMPSGVMSNFPEKEIKDIEAQTSFEFPDKWVIGTPATALWKPSGEREVPYITTPSIRKLEANDKRLAENQSGSLIVEEMPDGDSILHFWNFRDLIARERELITSIKDGATDFHRRIVEIIKRDGSCFPGRLADELGVSREKLDREIQFLVEDKSSPRRTWPGLRYDKAADRYSFHSDWIRRMLRYSFPRGKDDWHEDSFMLLGCLHAGYTTTDYEFVVNEIPRKILAYNVRSLIGAGDFIAGLYHHLHERGEVFNLNYPKQEKFAAELVGTGIIKVFRARFGQTWKSRSGKVTSAEVSEMIELALLYFWFIMGNHDKWQLNDSQEPLDKFHSHLRDLLREHIAKTLTACGAPYVDVEPIVKKHVQFMDPASPYLLPSGVRFAMIHPEMGRAATSNRAEKEIERFAGPRYRCPVVFIANFHTAVTVHKWHPNVGQCVALQQGALAISTDFELMKTKEVDFGVQMLKTLSYKGKIMRTSVASFNRPLLKKAYSKNENVDNLKKRLGILTVSE